MRHNNNSIDFEVKTATLPLWASNVSESITELTVLVWVIDPDYHKKTGNYSIMEVKKSMFEI